MEPKKQLILMGSRVYSENGKIEEGYIKIKGQKIVGIGEIDELEDNPDSQIVKMPSNFSAMPGFIDVHIHGANGADIMDASKKGLDTIVNALPKEGTTSFLATTLTLEGRAIEKAIINTEKFIQVHQVPGKAEILGIHLEGPFINRKNAGAQPKQYILEPDLELLKKWEVLANGKIKLVTLAPEKPGGLAMIQYLKEKGIIASIGHTDATYEEVLSAIEAGAKHATHLFNQMSGIHHRKPGAAGAALLKNEIMAELIVDGVHVHPEMVELAYKLKHKEGLILITDSIRAKCLKNGCYDLGGQDVIVKDGEAILKDGTLAGSVLKFGQAFKNILIFTGCTLEDAIEMASVNPAKQLNVFERKGSISGGKDADIVVLDENLAVFLTVCRGKIAYMKEKERK